MLTLYRLELLVWWSIFALYLPWSEMNWFKWDLLLDGKNPNLSNSIEALKDLHQLASPIIYNDSQPVFYLSNHITYQVIAASSESRIEWLDLLSSSCYLLILPILFCFWLLLHLYEFFPLWRNSYTITTIRR